MFHHYLTAALRHFMRHRTTTAINLIGLTLGLICFLAAHSVADFLSDSDRQFAKANRIYAVTQKFGAPGANMSMPTIPISAWPVAEHLKTDMPELTAVARLMSNSEAPLRTDELKTFANVSYADANFFDIFDWPFLQGDVKTALQDTRSAVLTEAMAQRLFGSAANALGKTVKIYGDVSLTVTGVLAPLKGMSHIGESPRVVNFDLLAPMNFIASDPRNAWMQTNWNTPMALTYALLPTDGSLTAKTFRERLKTFDDRYLPKREWQADFGAVPLSQIQATALNAMIGTDKSGISIISLLYGLGLLVLCVSALNYANLATAQAAVRAKEIGLRRVVGAGRATLAIQHIGEATLLTLVAGVLAVGSAAAIVPISKGMESSAGSFVGYFLSQLPLTLGAVVIVGLLSGAYPSFVLSRIPVGDALRSGRVRSGPRFVPTILVAVQFTVTSFLIVSILVMTAQHKRLEQAAFSTTGEPLVVLSNELNVARINFETLQTELLKQPHVRSVSASMVAPWSVAGALTSLSTTADKAARRWTVCNNYVESQYLATLDIKLVAGRDFDRARANDVVSARSGAVSNGASAIIDRELAEQSGWKPEQAVGKHLYLWAPGADHAAPPSVTIIGVTENKPQRLLGMGATSNIYQMQPARATRPIVRIAGSDIKAALEEIDSVWKRLAPNIAIKRQFADEMLNTSLSTFVLVTQIFQLVSLLALFIAILGLVGMSLHIINRRKHEIGVRKTLGASAAQVLFLLLKDFSKPVLIANLVAWPLAFGAMSTYLSLFVARMSLSFAPFLISLLATVSIAWLAVSIQATRAARLNPATVLRHE